MASDPDKLLDAVIAALAENRGASMAEISSSAGISRATLHRAFGSRDSLLEAAYARVLERCSQLFDEAGIDDADPVEAFERLSEDTWPLAQSHWLFLAAPHLEQVPHIVTEIEDQDARLERFFARGQELGVFRADLSARWISYSVGAQSLAAFYLVQDGYAGEKEVARLIKAAALEGIARRGGGDGPS